MKVKLNIFSNNKITNFLKTLLSKYDLVFFKLDSIMYNELNFQASIVIINNYDDSNLVNYENLGQNYFIISNIKITKQNINNKNKLLKTPVTINHIINKIENFLQNLKISFDDICVDNEKLINLNTNSFCYLTKIEFEILSCLIREKETCKNFIKENILNIKSNIETNSLESHLTRIRKKMKKINTRVRIQTKSEKLSITN